MEVNFYSTLSLAVQADSNSVPRVAPALLNYPRVRDLGGGGIEVTNGIYSFGNNTVDFHDLLWGGVRRAAFDTMLLSEPNGGFMKGGFMKGGFIERAIVGLGRFESQVEVAEGTGGWAAFV